MFLFFVESCNTSLRARLRVLSLRVFVGLGVEVSSIESSRTAVEDVLAEELEDLVDKPGTTIGT